MSASAILLARAEEIADRKTGEVFCRLFRTAKADHIKSAHLEDCRCDYCMSLKRHTNSAIQLHKAGKMIRDFSYNEKLFEDAETHFEWMSRQTEKTRRVKNAAKEL